MYTSARIIHVVRFPLNAVAQPAFDKALSIASSGAGTTALPVTSEVTMAAAQDRQDPQEQVPLVPDARRRRLLLSSAKRKALGIGKFGRSANTDVAPPAGGPGTDALADVVVELEPVEQKPPTEAAPSASAPSEGLGKRCVCLVS